jgi:hypothetical protein
MHGAKAGRLDQNIRVNFDLVAVDDRGEATGSGAM